MLDTARALEDMASQIRKCRAQDGLTLQQLASRSGVAASTIHKVEAQQMVPTVSVLLKIAKGLGRRPQELIRDRVMDGDGATNGADGQRIGPRGSRADSKVGVWRIDLAADQALPPLDLDPLQRAIVLVERGAISIQAGGRSVRLDAGDCIEVEGERIASCDGRSFAVTVTLIVSPRGDVDRHLGAPNMSRPAFSSS